MDDRPRSFEEGDDLSRHSFSRVPMPRDSLSSHRIRTSREDITPANRYKPRHISLQPQIDSLAVEKAYSQHSSDTAVPEIPALYRGNTTRASLAERRVKGYDTPDSYGPESIGPPISRSSPTSPVVMSKTQEICFIGVCAVSHLMTQAALGQALAPIDIISRDFHTKKPGEMSWFIAGYSLTVGTFILVSGRLGDIMGHKRIFCFGYLWLGIWSCFAGFSVYPHKQIFFDVCRAMQGIGPALLMPNALALFGRAYPPGMKKNIVFSIFGAVAPMGFVIGAASGGFFAQVAWWPWAFWSYGITAWALGAFALVVIPESLSHRPANPPRFDATGSILSVAGLVLVNVAWNNGPLYGWGTPHVYFVLIIGLLCLTAFLWVERRTVDPILPIQAFNSTIGFILACIGVGWASFGIWVFYMIRWMELLRHATPLSVSLQYVPAIVCGLLAAGLSSVLLTRTPVSFVMLCSMIAFCAGVIVAGTMPVNQIYWAQTFISIVIMPFGMDMSFPAATVILSNHMPPEHQGLAASLVSTVINYSISIALGIAGTVEVGVIGMGTTTPDDKTLEKGLRAAFLTAIGLSTAGVLLGAMFFARSMFRDGWKVQHH